MMKWLLIICLLLPLQPVFSQDDPAVLAKQLTAAGKNELEKVTSIFRWITENISYNTRPRYRKVIPTEVSDKFTRELAEDTEALKPLNERVATTVLLNKTAFCEGYARLFTTLCDDAGITSVIIPGYARGNRDRPGPRFGVNHFWNAVMIDSVWHLLDVTWASGYVSWQGDEFIQEYDPHYFLTPPQEFIRDHYPDDLQWTLLTDSPTPREFYNSPFRQKSYFKYRISSYYPSTGLINVAVGDTIHLSIESADAANDRDIIPDLLIDSSIFSRSSTWVFLQPLDKENPTYNSNRLTYTYTVTSQDIEWLFLLYNDDVVLRYKIIVRKEKETGTN